MPSQPTGVTLLLKLLIVAPIVPVIHYTCFQVGDDSTNVSWSEDLRYSFRNMQIISHLFVKHELKNFTFRFLRTRHLSR